MSILNKKPKRFLLIGVGTGDQALLINRLYPDSEIVIVELIDAVISEMKHRGSKFTKSLLEKSEIYIMDGSRYVKSKLYKKDFKKFDIIQIGVLHVTALGSGNLFTTEFLKEIKKILSKN